MWLILGCADPCAAVCPPENLDCSPLISAQTCSWQEAFLHDALQAEPCIDVCAPGCDSASAAAAISCDDDGITAHTAGPLKLQCPDPHLIIKVCARRLLQPKMAPRMCRACQARRDVAADASASHAQMCVYVSGICSPPGSEDGGGNLRCEVSHDCPSAGAAACILKLLGKLCAANNIHEVV